jgi:ribosomal RNA-processing protein 8
MFAVPGWSLSAPLKTQIGTGSLSSTAAEDGTTTVPSPSKKRKRKNGKGDRNEVTAENVATLWEQHIEGKLPQGKKLSANREPVAKRKRVEDSETVGQTNGSHEKRLSNGKSIAPIVKEVVSEAAGLKDAGAADRKKEKKDKKKKKRRIDEDDEHVENAVLPEKEQGNHKNAATTSSNNPKQKKADPTPATPPVARSAPKLTPLQASMRAKLASARFRHLNQTLYTSPSTDALDLFTKNPEMYSEYHAGFRQQVEIWPENPVDGYIGLIKARGKAKLNKKGEIKGHKGPAAVPESEIKLLPRTQGSCTIADLGCGDARLSQSLQPTLQKFQMKILSFDLQSESPLVKKADISALPLADGSVNVAIFCLALMGTNWTDFIDEAWRILHWKGELWVAEIKSRFARASNKKGNVVDHSVGKKRKKPSQMSEAQRKKAELEQKEVDDTLAVEVDGVENAKGETDVTPFVQVLKGRGFVLDGSEEEAVDLGNRMFVRMRFIKAAAPTKGKHVQSVAAGGKPAAPSKTFRGKYVRTDPEADNVDENAVLKPCVYKLR